MLIAVIVLSVIAIALYVYILYDIFHSRKKNTVVSAPAPVVEQPAEEPIEEPIEEPAPVTEIESTDDSEPEEDEDDEPADDDEREDEVTQVMPVVENGKTRYIVIKYSKSFLAKLIQSDDITKRYYSEIKNCLLSYAGVKSRISWKWETFRSGRKTLAKLRLRGKTLSLCLALNAEDFADTKYIVESLAEVKSYADTPCMYRIKKDRRLAYSKELIQKLMAENGLKQSAKAVTTDYAAELPYEETDALIERKLIKVLTDEDAQSGTKFKPSDVRDSVTAQEVDALMEDEVAQSLIAKSEGTIDRTKQGIINIDTLSECFESGEMVTLDEIKKRVKGFNKQTTYLKVLARGTLDKPLIVEADSFSLQAVKMIALTGGVAINKR